MWRPIGWNPEPGHSNADEFLFSRLASWDSQMSGELSTRAVRTTLWFRIHNILCALIFWFGGRGEAGLAFSRTPCFGWAKVEQHSLLALAARRRRW